eukprot:g1324.t1
MQKEDDAGDLMILLCEGQVERQADGHKILLDVGAVVGESGLISNVDGRLDVLTAKSTHPEAKPHFEAVTRRFRAGHQEEGEESWNIYRMSCFKDCSSRFLYLVDLHLERHIFFSDEIVDMYILYSGTMDVQVKGIKVGSLEGGMFFGEMAVLGLVKKRSATIVAVSLCDVRVLSRKSLEEAINDSCKATRNRMSLERRNGGRVHHLLFTTGQVIIKEGSDHGSLFLIHQGAATVSCAGEKVSELKTGDLCGELVAMGLSPVSTATELPKKTLLEVLERFPQERQQLRHVAALRMEWKHSLHGLQMFEWVSSSTAAMANKLEQLLTRWIFFCNDEIVIQGEPGDSLFMISIGFVEVLQNQHVIRELGGGDVFGELCALGISTTRTATVRCKD